MDEATGEERGEVLGVAWEGVKDGEVSGKEATVGDVEEVLEGAWEGIGEERGEVLGVAWEGEDDGVGIEELMGVVVEMKGRVMECQLFKMSVGGVVVLVNCSKGKTCSTN